MKKCTISIYKAFLSLMEKSISWSRSMLPLSSSELLSDSQLISLSSTLSSGTKNYFLFFNNNLYDIRLFTYLFVSFAELIKSLTWVLCETILCNHMNKKIRFLVFPLCVLHYSLYFINFFLNMNTFFTS